LKFIVKVSLEGRSQLLRKSKTILPTLFSMCLAMMVKFWHNNERFLMQRLLHACMLIIFFVHEYISDFGTNGVFEHILNNPLLTKIASTINYENMSDCGRTVKKRGCCSNRTHCGCGQEMCFNDEAFSEEQRLILEIYLTLMIMYDEQAAKNNVNFESRLENTVGISQA
jgi:hypothetical protein